MLVFFYFFLCVFLSSVSSIFPFMLVIQSYVICLVSWKSWHIHNQYTVHTFAHILAYIILCVILGMFETSREGEVGVALYCRKVLIKSRMENLLPKWLRKVLWYFFISISEISLKDYVFIFQITYLKAHSFYVDFFKTQNILYTIFKKFHKRSCRVSRYLILLTVINCLL